MHSTLKLNILTDIKEKIDCKTIMVRDLTTTILMNDRSFMGNINELAADLNNTINHMHPTDIYRTFHQTKAQYTLICMDLSWIDQDWSYVRPQDKAC